MSAQFSEAEVVNAEKEMSKLVQDSLKKHAVKPSMLFTSVASIRKLAQGTVGWARQKSMWPLLFGLSCCAIELMDFGSSRIDAERGGFLMFRGTPRQSDVMIVAGWVTKSMVPEIKRAYEQMLKPKYVIAYGECATCGGPWWESYNIIQGIDQVLPVDVYVAGCPPKPENLFAALIKLQKKIGGEIEG